MNIILHLQMCAFLFVLEMHKSCFHTEPEEWEVTPGKEWAPAAGSLALTTTAEGVRVLLPL